MIEPTLPLDEIQHQTDLEVLNLLDTGPDPRLDALLPLGAAMAKALEAEDDLLLIDQADKAFYQAKQAGRNRVVRG